MATLGLLGLGRMGANMARRLRRAGVNYGIRKFCRMSGG
jgi:3-hydroxyisobutyrate dehydrogenase-like beta-hydroxyacid dehydrogenase